MSSTSVTARGSTLPATATTPVRRPSRSGPVPTVQATTSVARTTVAPTAPAPVSVAGSVRALDLLALIPVADEHLGAGYDRTSFDYPSDPDGDGCDTEPRAHPDSSPAARVSGGCHVASGTWVSPYDGHTYTQPSTLEIDDVVALKEAWDSGAWAWSDARKAAFANDIAEHRGLRPVDGASNRTKGDKDPSNWIPENPADVCPYLSDWVSIKARWGLSMDQSEAGRIRNLLTSQCPNEMVAPFTKVPPAVAPAAPVRTVPSVQPVLPALRRRGRLRQLRGGAGRRRHAAAS